MDPYVAGILVAICGVALAFISILRSERHARTQSQKLGSARDVRTNSDRNRHTGCAQCERLRTRTQEHHH